MMTAYDRSVLEAEVDANQEVELVLESTLLVDKVQDLLEGGTRGDGAGLL